MAKVSAKLQAMFKMMARILRSGQGPRASEGATAFGSAPARGRAHHMRRRRPRAARGSGGTSRALGSSRASVRPAWTLYARARATCACPALLLLATAQLVQLAGIARAGAPRRPLQTSCAQGAVVFRAFGLFSHHLLQ